MTRRLLAAMVWPLVVWMTAVMPWSKRRIAPLSSAWHRAQPASAMTPLMRSTASRKGCERGPASEATAIAIPNRAADHVVEDVTRPEQAALYRLTGDRNPIHIDPMFAKFGGFERPFLHGLCTYGFAGRAALKALCGGDPARFISMSGRFSDQVYMGDSIITRIWEEGNGVAVMQVETQKGNVVLNQCRVEYRA